MKKIHIGLILALAAGTAMLPLHGFELDAHIRTELDYQDLRDGSSLNPDNVFNQNDIEARVNGRTRLRTDLGENVKAMLDLEFTYAPVLLDPSDPPPIVRIRELYTDIQTELFALKVGKQFLKWGSSEYFNPLDIINVSRAAVDSPRSEGNFFINLNIPVSYWLSLEAMTLVKTDLESITDLPAVGKIAFSFWQTSGFLFVHYQDGRKITGGLDFVLSLPFGEGFNVALYNQTLLRFESDRTYYTNADGVFTANTLPEEMYPAYVAGLRTDVSFTTTPFLNGIKAAVEYYYDRENWNDARLGTYFDYLDAVRADPAALGALLAGYTPLKNSRHYLYGSLAFVDPFIQDLQIECATILNLTDRSLVLMPHVSYLFNNGNTVCGIRSLINSGDDRTEFGNSSNTFKLELYAQTSF